MDNGRGILGLAYSGEAPDLTSGRNLGKGWAGICALPRPPNARFRLAHDPLALLGRMG